MAKNNTNQYKERPEDKAKQYPQLLTINGKNYKAVDWTQITFAQQQELKKALSIFLSGATKGEVGIFESSSDAVIPLLAGLYINEEEAIFNKATYKERILEFENAIAETFDFAGGLISDFLNSKASYIQGDIQTFLKAIMQIAQR